MSETLWAPWRMEYILSQKPDGCVFCQAAEQTSGTDDDNYVVHRGTSAFIIMNRFPYTHAHLLVVPNKHADRLEQLSDAARRELMDLWVVAQRLVIETFHPQGVNLGMNLGQAAGAGIESHLHAHIVPRWSGDTNFMPMLADTRVMPEHIAQTHQKLKSVFALNAETSQIK
jgi:ATP adenylyltransferase